MSEFFRTRASQPSWEALFIWRRRFSEFRRESSRDKEQELGVRPAALRFRSNEIIMGCFQIRSHEPVGASHFFVGREERPGHWSPYSG